MIIESLDIRRFGKLSDFKATFDGGFNLIEGPAESGKSTLAAFIVYMLYGFPVQNGTSLSERELRTPWDGGEAEGSMVFSVKGVRYRVHRTSTATERGWRDTYLLTNLDSGLAEEGGAAPGERFLGVSRETFCDTAFLSDVQRGGPDGEGISDAMENILFSGDEKLSSARAVRALDEAAHEIVSADGNAGAVAVLQKERDLLQEELDHLVAAEKLHFQREEELFLTRKKMEEARAEVEKFTKLETNFYNAMMIDDYDRLHALEDATDDRISAIHTHEDTYRASGFLPDREYLSTLTDERAEAKSAKKEEQEAQEAFSVLPEGKSVINEEEAALIAGVESAAGEIKVRADAKKYLQKTLRNFMLMAMSAVLFIAFLVLFVLFREQTAFAILFGALGVFGLGGVLVFLIEALRHLRKLRAVYAVCKATGREQFLLHLQRAAEAKLRVEHADAERQRAELRLSRAKERSVLAYKTLENTLARWGALPKDGIELPDAVEPVLERAERFLTQDEQLRAAHKAAEAEVLALREKLSGQNEVAVRARLAPDERKRYRNQNAKDLRRGVETYEARLKTLCEEEGRLLSLLAAEQSREEDAAAVAERIMALDGRMTLLRENALVLTMAKDAVMGGEERLRREISPRLSLDACRYLYEMTDGKYSNVSVANDYGLTFDEGEGARSVAFLSHSTEDLAYYSLRLALLSLLYRDGTPICFDSCTARQDDDRALSFLRAVRTLCEDGRQCFFFASGKREHTYVSQVFSSYRRIVMPTHG